MSTLTNSTNVDNIVDKIMPDVLNKCKELLNETLLNNNNFDIVSAEIIDNLLRGMSADGRYFYGRVCLFPMYINDNKGNRIYPYPFPSKLIDDNKIDEEIIENLSEEICGRIDIEKIIDDIIQDNEFKLNVRNYITKYINNTIEYYKKSKK